MSVLWFSQHDFPLFFLALVSLLSLFFFGCCFDLLDCTEFIDWLARSRTEGMLPKRKTWCLSWPVMSVLFWYSTRQTTTMIGPGFSISFWFPLAVETVYILWRGKKEYLWSTYFCIITIKILILWTSLISSFSSMLWQINALFNWTTTHSLIQ